MEFIFDPSLALYLPLYEPDGASFTSKDAYGHLCTVTGALWTPRGRSFDGIDDQISCGNAASLNAFDSNSAVAGEFWAYINSATNSTLLNKSDEVVGNTGYIFALISGNMAMYLNGVARYSSVSVATSAWHHLAYTWDGSGDDKVRFYLDGELRETSTAISVLTSNTDPAIIGGTTGGFARYSGLIGEVRLYNRALTLHEIQHNYLATKWRYR